MTCALPQYQSKLDRIAVLERMRLLREAQWEQFERAIVDALDKGISPDNIEIIERTRFVSQFKFKYEVYTGEAECTK